MVNVVFHFILKNLMVKMVLKLRCNFISKFMKMVLDLKFEFEPKLVKQRGGGFLVVLAIFTKVCWVGKHMSITFATDELPNPRPTQPEKKSFKSHFSPHFVGWDCLYGKQTTRNPTQPKLLANTLLSVVCS